MKIKEIINKTLEEEMNLNPDVFILGEEVGKSGGPHGLTKNLMAKFGKHRVLDTPISEMGFTGLAVGASYLGLRPVIDYMTWNFALQSIDHIINSCAKTRYMSGGRITCPIVFRGPNGFNKGYAAQHTQDFSTFYGNIPGLKVVAPYTAKDHAGLLRAAIRDPDPVVILENEMLYDDEYESEYEEGYIQSLDKAIIEKDGQDLTIIGVSLSLREIFKAEIELTEIGISAEIINLVSIRPLDTVNLSRIRGNKFLNIYILTTDTNTIFKSVNKTGRLLIIDYSYPLYGLSSEISAQVYENCSLKKPIKRLNAKDVPTPYSKSLEDMVYPKKEDIIEAAKILMN